MPPPRTLLFHLSTQLPPFRCVLKHHLLRNTHPDCQVKRHFTQPSPVAISPHVIVGFLKNLIPKFTLDICHLVRLFLWGFVRLLHTEAAEPLWWLAHSGDLVLK